MYMYKYGIVYQMDNELSAVMLAEYDFFKEKAV